MKIFVFFVIRTHDTGIMPGGATIYKKVNGILMKFYYSPAMSYNISCTHPQLKITKLSLSKFYDIHEPLCYRQCTHVNTIRE